MPEAAVKRQAKWMKGGPFHGASLLDQDLPMERWFETPRKWTFQMPKLRAWVESRLEGRVLCLFGGVTPLTHTGEIVYNDINMDIGDQTYLRRDACDVTLWQDLGRAFDTVVFDPPFSHFQAVKTYGIKRQQAVNHARDVVEFVLKPGGVVISLGFNSTGMSNARGFKKEALALVNGGGSHNDYIILSERQVG